MKDKLVRTGHKKTYYRFKAFGFALLAVAGAGVAAAAPVAISYGASYSQIAHAEENKDGDEQIEGLGEQLDSLEAEE